MYDPAIQSGIPRPQTAPAALSPNENARDTRAPNEHARDTSAYCVVQTDFGEIEWSVGSMK
jgi:hypothetical protein